MDTRPIYIYAFAFYISDIQLSSNRFVAVVLGPICVPAIVVCVLLIICYRRRLKAEKKNTSNEVREPSKSIFRQGDNDNEALLLERQDNIEVIGTDDLADEHQELLQVRTKPVGLATRFKRIDEETTTVPETVTEREEPDLPAFLPSGSRNEYRINE